MFIDIYKDKSNYVSDEFARIQKTHNNVSSFLWLIFNDMKSMFFSILTGFLSMKFSELVMNNKNDSIILLSIISIISSQISTTIRSFMNYQIDNIEIYKIIYENIKAEYNDPNDKEIKKWNDKIDKYFLTINKQNSDLEHYVYTIEKLLFARHSLNQIKDNKIVKDLSLERYDEVTKRLINSRPQEERDQIDIFLNQIRDIDRHTQALFYGPPGTGKTTFAIEIAKMYELEYCIMNCSLVRSLQEIIYGIDDYEDRSKRSLLFDFVVQIKSYPVIIILDEFGSLFVDETWRCSNEANSKLLFDDSKQILNIKQPNIQIDYSKFIFIATSNVEYSNNALKERLPVFVFNRIDVEILRGIYNDLTIQYDPCIYMFQYHKDFIISEYQKYFPGARVLKEVIRYLKMKMKLNKELNENDICMVIELCSKLYK